MLFFRKVPNPAPWFVGLRQALAVVAYILAFTGLIMSGVLMDIEHTASFLAPAVFLSMFSVSALICGTIAFFYPVRLLLEKRYTDAMMVIVWMAVWMLVFVVGLIALAAMVSQGVPVMD